MKVHKPKPMVDLLKPIDDFLEPYISNLLNDIDKIYGNGMLDVVVNYGKMVDDKGRYLHWDKFRRIHKEGSETKWLVTKMSRFASIRHFTIGEYQFLYNVPASLQALLHFIDKNCAGHLGTDGFGGLSREEQNHFLIKSLVMEESITSAQLEGALTTRKVAKEMLESERNPRTKDEMMILNNYRLMRYAVDCKNQDISVGHILKMHEIATQNAIENHAVPGRFRQDDEIFIADYDGNVLYRPPAFHELEALMEAFCDFANHNHNDTGQDFMHPVVKAIILHFLIGFIHPFGDGNGRTARALFYWFMLKQGYWLFEYVSISRLLKNAPTKYARAYLYVETDDLDVTYFLYHQAETIKQAITDLAAYINDKQRMFKEFGARIASFTASTPLNHRQIGILQKAVKEAGTVFSVKEVSNEFSVTENTARKDLNGLRDLKLLGVVKSGNGLIYIAPDNLPERLR